RSCGDGRPREPALSEAEGSKPSAARHLPVATAMLIIILNAPNLSSAPGVQILTRDGHHRKRHRSLDFLCYYFSRTSRDPRADLNSGAIDNEGPYLRPSSQGSWMEEMRAHRKCAPSSFMTHAVRNQFTIQLRKEEKPCRSRSSRPI